MVDQIRKPQKTGTGLVNIIKSTLAAACGIQSRQNHERDFALGNASSFVAAGVVFVVIFVLIIYSVVQLVVSQS